MTRPTPTVPKIPPGTRPPRVRVIALHGNLATYGEIDLPKSVILAELEGRGYATLSFWAFANVYSVFTSTSPSEGITKITAVERPFGLRGRATVPMSICVSGIVFLDDLPQDVVEELDRKVNALG